MPSAPPSSSQPQQQKPNQQQKPSGNTQPLLSWLQQRWEQLDVPQRAYTVIVGLVLLAALPKVLTVLVLVLERFLIGGLLALEEVLLELLLRGGALVSMQSLLRVWHKA